MTESDALAGNTTVLGPKPDNQSGGNGQRDTPFGYGNQMGLAVYAGQVYPMWAGNFNVAHVVNGAITGDPLNIWLQPMGIAAGPRVISSTMGTVAAATLTGTGSTQSAADVPQFVPPNGTGTVTTSIITLPGDPSLVVNDLQVTIPSLTYSNLSDLTGTLIAPDGTSVTLFGPGLLSGANLTNTILSDLVSFSGLLTKGSTTITGLSSLAGLAVGAAVTGYGIPAGTTIKSIGSANSAITLSASATVTGAEILARFHLWSPPAPLPTRERSG